MRRRSFLGVREVEGKDNSEKRKEEELATEELPIFPSRRKYKRGAVSVKQEKGGRDESREIGKKNCIGEATLLASGAEGSCGEKPSTYSRQRGGKT